MRRTYSTTPPHVYRNESSFAVYRIRVREFGTNGPHDGGEIEQLAQLSIWRTMSEAQDHIAYIRHTQVVPENEAFSVTERIHNEYGKIVDHMQDEYVG